MSKHKPHKAAPQPATEETEDDSPKLATGELADAVMREAAANTTGPVPHGSIEDEQKEEEPLPGVQGERGGIGPSGIEGPLGPGPGPVGEPGPQGQSARALGELPPCPPVGEAGDKTRDYFVWQCRYGDLDKVKAKYIGRFVAGQIVTESIIMQVRASA